MLVDEIAFLTAYQADRKLKERILAALATLMGFTGLARAGHRTRAGDSGSGSRWRVSTQPPPGP